MKYGCARVCHRLSGAPGQAKDGTAGQNGRPAQRRTAGTGPAAVPRRYVRSPWRARPRAASRRRRCRQ